MTIINPRYSLADCSIRVDEQHSMKQMLQCLTEFSNALESDGIKITRAGCWTLLNNLEIFVEFGELDKAIKAIWQDEAPKRVINSIYSDSTLWRLDTFIGAHELSLIGSLESENDQE